MNQDAHELLTSMSMEELNEFLPSYMAMGVSDRNYMNKRQDKIDGLYSDLVYNKEILGDVLKDILNNKVPERDREDIKAVLKHNLTETIYDLRKLGELIDEEIILSKKEYVAPIKFRELNRWIDGLYTLKKTLSKIE